MNLFGHLVGLLGRGISLTQGLYLHRTTQHRKTRTHMHAPTGIRTRDPIVRAAEDSTCLRPRGHWDRRSGTVLVENNDQNFRRWSTYGACPHITYVFFAFLMDHVHVQILVTLYDWLIRLLAPEERDEELIQKRNLIFSCIQGDTTILQEHLPYMTKYLCMCMYINNNLKW
jgi:hypothetical protein